MQFKILKVILVSLLSLSTIASNEHDSLECIYGYELNDLGHCLKLLKNDKERQKGLMFEKNLPHGHRVIFQWKQTKKICMWMKNTSIPLDIQFYDPALKTIVVEKGVPFSKKRICHRAKVVTEANRGELVDNPNEYGILLKNVR
jgi:hypothetical protein